MNEELIAQLISLFETQPSSKPMYNKQLTTVWSKPAQKMCYKVWNNESKARMVVAVQQCGYNIAKIQHDYFPDKTFTQLKNQYFYLKKIGRLAQ